LYPITEEIPMKLTHLLIVSAFTCITIGRAQAGPIIKMLEEKKAKQAASSTSPAPAAQPPTAAPATTKSNPQFDTAKKKCKELGNKEGSDKFNSCVMTLME
jgi:ribosomal protein L12E/L44/L45/RPP1/RPP2